MANNKKKPASKSQFKKAKKFPVKPVIAAVIAAALIAALVLLIVLRTNEDNAKHVLRSTVWVSQTAKTASGDEVDIREVYNVKYSNYQGRLTFDDSGRFELWLSPGDAAGGDHSGTYTLKDDVISAVFDNGAAVDFGVRRKDGKVTQIDVAYEEYTVSFFPA